MKNKQKKRNTKYFSSDPKKKNIEMILLIAINQFKH